ncbi:MAG TPA: hypothetical protein PKM65_19445 [Spirochaetota bacterium]|nr:hypothetical protein [Spirochaetota bacterium]HNT12995.1 hypothetical protein [Spirochaetota bacterium]
MLRLNRGIIKLVRGSGGSFDDYRYYVIARRHCAVRSGIFSLSELCDLLHAEYGYASLRRGPGNNRGAFRRRLARILEASPLFVPLADGRYRIRAERALLRRVNASRPSMWFELPDASVLASRRAFYDFCVGVLLAGNKFRANRNIARYCGCTVRRIQYATARNHRGDSFLKRYNFIEDFTGTYEEVEKFRAILFNVHGISSPLPRRHKGGEWVARLNAPNSYTALVLSGVKGAGAQPTCARVQYGKKEQCWFVPAWEKRGPVQPSLFVKDHPVRRWYFNERVYGTDRYIGDHSRLYA